ncbi:MAG: hypothetical protein V3U16_09305, partial [Candidatus Neomarinimicrobiota bacterium]
WHYDEDYGLINLSLLIANNVILVPYMRGRIVALDTTTGKELWNYSTEHTIHQVKILPNGILLYDSNRNLILLGSKP